MNPAEKFTQSESLLLERRLFRLYRDAYLDTLDESDKFWKRYEREIRDKYTEYQDGKISQQDYWSWVNGHKNMGKRIDGLAENIATRMTSTGAIASSYINNTSPKIFQESANYEAYTMEKELHGAVSFTLINDDALKAVIEGNSSEFDAKWKHNPNALPWNQTNIDNKKIYKWSYSKVQDAVYTGILRGESIPKISNRLLSITESNRATAVRNARTAITSAYNSGQMASFERAAKMGLEVTKEWIATSDKRTRDSHAHLDGVRVPWDEEFPNGLMHPAYPNGSPAEVYNCRCAMKRVPFDESASLSTYWDADAEEFKERYNTVESYEAWKNRKSEDLTLNLQDNTDDYLQRARQNIIDSHNRNIDRQGMRSVRAEGENIDKIIKIDFGNLSDESARAFSETFADLCEKYDSPLSRIRLMSKEEAMFNNMTYATTFRVNGYGYSEIVINPIKCADYDKMVSSIKNNVVHGHAVQTTQYDKYIATHEFAHSIVNIREPIKDSRNWVNEDFATTRKFRKEITSMFDDYSKEISAKESLRRNMENDLLTASSLDEMNKIAEKVREVENELSLMRISKYSTQNSDEFFAEAFTDVVIGDNTKEISKKVFDVFTKYYGR